MAGERIMDIMDIRELLALFRQVIILGRYCVLSSGKLLYQVDIVY